MQKIFADLPFLHGIREKFAASIWEETPQKQPFKAAQCR